MEISLLLRLSIRALALCIVTLVSSNLAFGEIRLQSDPAGSWLRLDGPASVSGSTPLPIDVLPEGRYLLQAGGAGIPAVRARIHSDANQQLAAKGLVPPGSILLPPGSSHFRAREHARGGVFFAAGTGAAFALGYAESSRRDADDEFTLAAQNYSRAVSEQTIEDAWSALLLAQQRRDDESRMRDLWSTYLAITWASASLETWLTPRPTLHQHANGDYLLSMPRVTSWQAVWRSTLVPGAGQRYLGRNTRANVAAFLTYGLAAGGLIAYDALLDARRDRDEAQRRYDQAVTSTELERRRGILDTAAGDANDHNTWRWSLFGAAAAVHLWSILDAWQVAAYSGSSPPGQQPVPSSDVSFQIAPQPSGVRAALAWRFP